MADYVDVYVVPVKKDKLEDYRKIADAAGKVWKKLGALEYIEVVADDVESGVSTSFPQATKLEEDEVVVVGWITFKSREDRDRVNAAVMQDPWMKEFDPTNLAFDGKRMFWGGFKPIVQF